MRADWRLGALRYAFEARQGKQFALNAGITLSKSELLAFTDDDIIFLPGWITNICAAFDETDALLVGGKTLVAWPETGAPSWYAPSMAAVLGGVDLGEQRLLPAPSNYAPAGANLAARRVLFDRVGFFSETHFRHMDYEFGLRCANALVRIAYDPALIVLAPVDEQMLTKRYFRRWSFKAGITHSDDGSNPAISKFLGVPRWIYRQLIGDLLCLPVESLFKPPAQTFQRELRIWRNWGSIASCWYALTWPHKYPEWVKHYSQKKKNVY
jgi:glycosyltransferase involved in cell wall biosynthesis